MNALIQPTADWNWSSAASRNNSTNCIQGQFRVRVKITVELFIKNLIRQLLKVPVRFFSLNSYGNSISLLLNSPSQRRPLIDNWRLLSFYSAMNNPNGSGAMFDGIAKNYDLLNTLTSLGFDRHWRKKAVTKLELTSGQTLLDLAAGTLDISLLASQMYPAIRVIAADPSRKMLKVGRKKVPMQSNIDLLAAAGEALPLASGSIHAAVIAFGIRNFTEREQSLKQLARVLVPGGRLVILELSIPTSGIMAPAASFYIRKIIPLLGAVLSSGAEYAYLPESMKRFPAAPEFEAELKANGFNVHPTVRFMSGACHLFVCDRQRDPLQG